MQLRCYLLQQVDFGGWKEGVIVNDAKEVRVGLGLGLG